MEDYKNLSKFFGTMRYFNKGKTINNKEKIE